MIWTINWWTTGLKLMQMFRKEKVCVSLQTSTLKHDWAKLVTLIEVVKKSNPLYNPNSKDTFLFTNSESQRQAIFLFEQWEPCFFPFPLHPQCYWKDGEDLSKKLTFLYNILIIKVRGEKFVWKDLNRSLHGHFQDTESVVIPHLCSSEVSWPAAGTTSSLLT